MLKLLKGLVFGVLEIWVRSFVACYGLRVAGYILQSLDCNILTRNPERETRNDLSTPILRN